MALRPNLHSIALVTPTDGVILVGDGTNWVGESGATAQASLGLAIGTNVQAHDDDLDTWAGITPSDYFEPTGFINRTSSTLSWDDSSYTLTIAPSGGTTFSFYSNGVKFSKTSTQKQITNVSGLHYIYFDTTGTIQQSTDAWTIASGNVPVATVYWNAVTGKGLLADERHGCQMDGQTHEYLHETRGAAYAYGLAGTFAGDGSTIQIDSGEWYDDDIEYQPTQQTTCRVIWRGGSVATWSDARAQYWTDVNGAVAAAPAYDNAGTLTALDSAKFSNMWIYQTNLTSTPILAVVGQAQYNTQALAEAATPAALTLSFLPAAELILLYQVTYQNNGGAFLKKTVKDYRKVGGGSPTNYTATDHRALTNLTWGSSGHTGTASTAATFDADGLATYVAYGSMILQAANNVNIDGGAIDGTTIGAASAAAGTFTTVTTSGAIGAQGAVVTGYPVTGYQTADAQGFKLFGYDDRSAKFIHAYVSSAGDSYLYANDSLTLFAQGGYLQFLTAAAQPIYCAFGGLFYFQDIDDNSQNRVTISSSTGEVTIISSTVGLKLGAAGGQTFYSDGTNFLFAGGDINANGNTIFFGAAENTQTPAVGNSDTVTIDLGAENHHTLTCGSATGAVTCNLTVPPGPTAGTIIVVQGATARDITWTPSAGSVVWLGTEPTWSSDTNKTRIVSWRYNATNLYLSATDTN